MILYLCHSYFTITEGEEVCITSILYISLHIIPHALCTKHAMMNSNSTDPRLLYVVHYTASADSINSYGKRSGGINHYDPGDE